MWSRSLRLGLGVAAGTTLALTSLVSVSAHEHRIIGGGHYAIVIGWQQEPTFTGVRNAVQMFLSTADGKPVNTIASPDKLQVSVTTGSATSGFVTPVSAFDPDSGEGTPGEFDAPLMPMTAGTYVFHVVGSLGGIPIDERFASSENTFDNVQDVHSIQFPGGGFGQAAPAMQMGAAAALPLLFFFGGKRLVGEVRRRRGA